MTDFAYVNLTMSYTGNDPNGNVLASSNVQYNTPIIDRPSDFYMCVSRFIIDGFNVPLIIPLLATGAGQTDVNKLAYKFMIAYTDNVGVTTYSDAINVQYVPNDNRAILPIAPSGGILSQDLSSNYYYIYTYGDFLTMWNTALDNALINLGTKTTLPIGITAPKFYFQSGTGINLIADSAFYGKSLGTTLDNDKFSVFFNGEISTLVNGLPSAYIKNPTGVNNVFLMYDQVINKFQPSLSSIVYWLLTMQNVQETSFWTTATSYQILTNIPIVKEYIQGVLGTNQQQSQVSSILTDFSPDTSNDVAYHTKLVYNKTDSLRMIQLSSDTPLYTVSASVYFTDNYGRQFPLYIGPNCLVTIKFEFVRKSVYANMNSVVR
jgi:hypothetical protein